MGIESKKVKEKALEHGARLVGIGSVDRWNGAPVTMRPESLMPGAKSVIVIGVPISRGLSESIPSHYWCRIHGHLMGGKVDDITDDLANWLEDQHHKSMSIGGLSMAKDVHKKFQAALGDQPYPIFSDFGEGGMALNIAGALCGLGTIGKNGLLLTEQYGPNVILGGVITTAEIEPDPLLDYEICTNCNKCVDGCPGKAIDKNGNPGIDKSAYDGVKCFLYNAMEGRAMKTAMDRGDKAVIDFLTKTVFMQSEATPATCVCGRGCLTNCPTDPRARKLK